MHFIESDAFTKNLKRLSKKYRTLEDDLEKLKQVLESAPTGIGKNFTIIHVEPAVKVVKARMACRALRERSLRVIYACQEAEAVITFIELYFKGEQVNESRTLINEFLRRINKSIEL